MKRYKYESKETTEEERKEIQERKISSNIHELQYHLVKAAEAVAFIKRHREEDGPKEIPIQTELNPGDEGYDEAPPIFDPLALSGSFTWVDFPNDKYHYRLLDESDTVMANDEFLEDDTVSWSTIGQSHSWCVGHKWNTALVPMRRLIES